MSQVLLITSSPRIESYSSRVGRSLAEKLASRPGSSLTVRDLTRHPLPHIDDSFALARNTPADFLTSAQRETLAASDKLLVELFAADTIVLAAGMINFGIPSSLKAYIDHIVRPGVTFRYGEKGPEGLIKGKKAYLVLARGGVYTQGPMQAYNFQDTYLRVALGFIGITDVEVIAVEGVAFGPEAAEKAVSAALGRVAAISSDQ
ncbi:MAG TPA: FMN-dependent NADH-azoreductase [Steroidobacteraceae bacterium]|nr:FMN-dependent NADH-azoreductase [Steroidobacteraceae bacterium]